jgi:hypothetical protein
MTGFWNSFKQNSHRKKALKEATERENPEAILAFLRDYPHEEAYFVDRAMSMSRGSGPWHSLLICAGLAMAESPQAVVILQGLMKEDFPGWKRLPTRYIQHLAALLQKQNAWEVYSELARRVSISAQDPIAFNIQDERSLQWLDGCVKAGLSIESCIARIAGDLEALALSPSSLASHEALIRNSHRAGLILWTHKRHEESLEILNILSMLHPELIQRDFLKDLAEQLPSWIPRPGGKILIEHSSDLSREFDLNFRRQETVSAIPLRIVRAANLLRAESSAEWVPALKESLLRLEGLTRRPWTNLHESPLPPDLVAANNAVAMALGVCSACARDYTALEMAGERTSQLEKELKSLIENRNQLVGQHNVLVDRYINETDSADTDARETEERIRQIRRKLAEFDSRIGSVRNEVKASLSPGALLLMTLLDRSAYPAEVRQGAAWGLYKLAEEGHLKRNDVNRISEALRCALFEDGCSDMELQTKLDPALPQSEQVSPACFGAIVDFLRTPSRRNLEEARHTFSPLIGSQNAIRDALEGICQEQQPSHDFQERMVQFLPGMSILEFEGALRDAIAWVLDVMAKERLSETLSELSTHLRWIIRLLHQFFPEIFSFLREYPLRLMSMDQHKRLLGKYTREKCGVILWTSFTPPLWKPGMSQENAGEVHERYVTLDDRSKPNSMGICYHLFKHPVLVLPVIYHEYMHFGGPTGEPDKGLSNESEVLIQEIVFMRSLIARLAPADDNLLPEFERELIAAIEGAGLKGLGLQILYDIASEEGLHLLCDEVEALYGKQMSPQEAVAKVERTLQTQNRSIRLNNHTDEMKLNWHPEMEWPELNGETTRRLTEQYRQVLQKSLTENHRISYSRLKGILKEETCARFEGDWNRYRMRPNAGVEFQKAWPLDDLELEELLLSIVDRYIVRDEQDRLDAAGFLSMLLDRVET